MTQIKPPETLPADIITQTQIWFQRAVPLPVEKNVNAQTGVHFEEVAEMIEQMRGLDPSTQILLDDAHQALTVLGNHLKSQAGSYVVEDQELFADALADQIVTTTGVGHMLGYNVPGALNEVNRSNWSKFVDGFPIFNENQKIMKGPDYSVADLKPFLPPVLE